MIGKNERTVVAGIEEQGKILIQPDQGCSLATKCGEDGELIPINFSLVSVYGSKYSYHCLSLQLLHHNIVISHYCITCV